MKKLSYTPQQFETATRLINATNNLLKTVCGTANNAAWAACLDAIDQIRKHPRYRQQITGGTTPAREFKRAFNMLHDYERRLIFGSDFFHVANMSPQTRKSYGPDFSDRDYYEFWCAFGFQAYETTKPFFTSLVNKIRLAYLNHGDPNPDIMGWAGAAQAALEVAAQLWDAAIYNCQQVDLSYSHMHYTKRQWQDLYACFSLRHVADFWRRCVNDLCPLPITLTDTENSNILLGVDQLEKEWMDEDTIYGSRIRAAEDYADIFRTNGEMKKAMRQYAEMRDRVAHSLD